MSIMPDIRFLLTPISSNKIGLLLEGENACYWFMGEDSKEKYSDDNL
jgi:hypothetical protein